MVCRNCLIYPFCKKTTKASDSCNEGIKRKLESEVKYGRSNNNTDI